MTRPTPSGPDDASWRHCSSCSLAASLGGCSGGDDRQPGRPPEHPRRRRRRRCACADAAPRPADRRRSPGGCPGRTGSGSCGQVGPGGRRGGSTRRTSAATTRAATSADAFPAFTAGARRGAGATGR